MIYDYKSDEVVQDIVLDCFCPLIEDISDEYSTLRRYENLSMYAPSNVARELIGRILEEIDDVWVHADSRNELLYSYDNEVIITIASDGMIFVENARTEDGKLKCNYDCSLTYVYDGFSKKEIDELSGNEDSILIFGFNEVEIENDDEEPEKIPISGIISSIKEEIEKIDKIFTNDISKEHSTIFRVNGKEVDKKTFESAMAKIDNMYLDNVRDMLLRYCSIMDEMNEWRKLLW